MRILLCPELFERVSGSILRRLFGGLPLSSTPYISGDSYRNACEVDLTHSGFDQLKSIDPGTKISIFLPIARAHEFAVWVEKNLSNHNNWQIILHNGDHSLSEPDLHSLRNYFAGVKSVNWLGDRAQATPIPIGLENLNLFRNGIPQFYKSRDKEVFRDWDTREFEVFLSVKKENNLGHRVGLETFLSFSERNVISKEFLPPKRYREIVRKSRFVVSPPGNGPDCHRTWEAIYLGSVPIVLRKFWNFSESLPVLIVESYSEIKDAIPEFEKDFIFHSFKPSIELQEKYFNRVMRRTSV